MLHQGEIDRYQDALRMLRDYYKSMLQPIPDEMKQEYARLPLFELMEAGERPPSVAESLVDYEAKPPGTPGDDAGAQTDTPKKGKRGASASKNSKRTPTPLKSPKGGKKGAGKKEKEAPAPAVDTAAQATSQDPSAKSLKPK